ncbi:uncharacterized protein CIMG_08487 [Coccidioides immitis RS]|uniref:RBR-type E3 ubiquitin transferase n=2 Tax=Coccidioides immitis TaxID=5501 RepID=J3K5L1_COCIM|nr:uncharacterized protein CIMG_08487 [Coccidioides immitis RS]EAS29741.3 hypothetical protein CIMG_08487 [Coccidioides immitis RS]
MPTTSHSASQISLPASDSRHRRRRRYRDTEDRNYSRKSRAVEDEDHKSEGTKSRSGTRSGREVELPDSRSKMHGGAERRHRRSTTATGSTPERSRVGTTSETKTQRASQTPKTRPASVHRHSTSSTKPPSSSKEKKTSSNNPTPGSQKTKEASKNTSLKQPPSVEGKRNSNYRFLGSLFGNPHPPVEKKITCLTCLSDDVPISKSAKLACSHRMCNKCLKRIFTMSVSDPQHMPPRCCTDDHIPLKHVDRLFDSKFKNTWNRKYQEYTTKNRLYCPARGCGEWIKPKNIQLDTSNGPTCGRKYGKCSKCKTKVCVLCNRKMHRSKDCPNDEDTKRFNEIAQESGWKRCYNCSAMVELKEGCNHMTCRCTAEFCIICGSKWKTCDCPWFNYHTPGGGAYPDIPQGRMMDEQGNEDVRAPIRYQQELDMRRAQERQDEVLARRLQQVLGLDDDDDGSTYDYSPNNRYTTNIDPADVNDAFPPIYDDFYLPSRFAGTHTPPPPEDRITRTDLPPDDPPMMPPDQVPRSPRMRTQPPDSARRRRRRKQATARDMPSSSSRAQQWRLGLGMLPR